MWVFRYGLVVRIPGHRQSKRFTWYLGFPVVEFSENIFSGFV